MLTPSFKVKKRLLAILVVLAAFLELVLITLLVKRFLTRYTETMFCFDTENIDNVKGKPEWVEHFKSKKGETIIDGQYCVEASETIDAIVTKVISVVFVVLFFSLFLFLSFSFVISLNKFQ
jgi:hypothetical protein